MWARSPTLASMRWHLHAAIAAAVLVGACADAGRPCYPGDYPVPVAVVDVVPPVVPPPPVSSPPHA